MVFLYLLSKIVCNVAGFLYPAYVSFKAVKANNTQQLATWLMYWIVMALFTVIESVADLFIFWVPLYYEAKMVLVLWLIHPQTQGAAYLYVTYVSPAFTRHEGDIDSTLATAQEQAKRTGMDWGRKGLQTLQKAAADGLMKGQSMMAEQGNRPDASSTSEEKEHVPRPRENITSTTVRQERSISMLFAAAAPLLPGVSAAVSSSSPPSTSNTKSLPSHLLQAPTAEQEKYIQTQRQELQEQMKQLEQAERVIQQRKKVRGKVQERSSTASADEGDSEFESLTTEEIQKEQQLQQQQKSTAGLRGYLSSYWNTTPPDATPASPKAKEA